MKPLDILNLAQISHSINIAEISIALKEMLAEKGSSNNSERFIVFNDIMRFCFGSSFVQRFFSKTVTVTGDEDDFHNLFVTLANAGLYSWAILVVDKGLELYPRSTDLLTDYIRSSTYFKKLGSSRKRSKCIFTLTKIPRDIWTWISYSSYINFLIEELMREDKTALETQKQTIQKLINDFRENIPQNEGSYYLESQFYDVTEKNAPQKSIDILEKALAELEVFPAKCATKLTMKYLDVADYDKAIDVLLKCKKNIVCFEDVESIGGVCFQLVLARLGKYFRKETDLSDDEKQQLYMESRKDFLMINKMSFNLPNAQSLYAKLETLAAIFSEKTGYSL